MKMFEAWEAAIPEARRIAKALASSFPSQSADDLEQTMLAEFPVIWRKIKNEQQYTYKLKKALHRVAYVTIDKHDRLGIGLGQTQARRIGHKDGGSFDAHFLEQDEEGYGGEPEFPSRVAQRVDNFECFWCGTWFELNLDAKQRTFSNLYCCSKCSTNGRNVKRAAAYFRPIVARLRAGIVQVGELRAMCPKWMSVIKALERLGYQFETNVTAGACKNGYYRLTHEGICLPR